MSTTFTIIVEEDLTRQEADSLLSDLEEVVGKANYYLNDSDWEMED